MRKNIISLIICVAFCTSTNAQLTYRCAFGVGGSPYPQHDIVKTFSGAIGYTFGEELLVFGGINLFSQSSYLFNFESNNDDGFEDESPTQSLTSFIIQGGIHYSITLKTFTKNRSQWEYKRIGIFPEVNAYFNPYLPRKYEVNDDTEYKAPYKNQLAYGIGGGILYGSWRMYIALKYECNTIDNLKSIHTLVPDLEKKKKLNHIVSLIFMVR
nr:hypothetical protein [uncultured Carboxylicivirga sp.]